jgi:hypothetical protein
LQADRAGEAAVVAIVAVDAVVAVREQRAAVVVNRPPPLANTLVLRTSMPALLPPATSP